MGENFGTYKNRIDKLSIWKSSSLDIGYSCEWKYRESFKLNCKAFTKTILFKIGFKTSSIGQLKLKIECQSQSSIQTVDVAEFYLEVINSVLMFSKSEMCALKKAHNRYNRL